MANTISTIRSRRLDLMAMSPRFLKTSLAGDDAAAEKLLGLKIPAAWFSQKALIKRRLSQLQADPGLQQWLLRGIGLRSEGLMIGHIGFHDGPGADYLQELAPGGIEFGYTVYPTFRRQGYAFEACQALMAWARNKHGVTRFVLSISPENLPSLGLAHKLGFKRIGSHIDEVDGLEDIFEYRFPEMA